MTFIPTASDWAFLGFYALVVSPFLILALVEIERDRRDSRRSK